MKNNKIIMSLVLASISAMAAAPFLIEEKKDGKKDDVANKDAADEATTVVEGKKIIDLDAVKTAKMDDSLKDDFTKQMDAMLMKKSSVQQLSESVSILVDNYGHEDQSLRNEIYKELNFAQGTQDSTGAGMGIAQPPGSGWGGAATVVCHNACHSACHVACHGSRGWR